MASILINFSHPLSDEHLAALRAMIQQPVIRLIDAPAQLDVTRPFAEQVRGLVDGVGLTALEWQTAAILVNPPSLNAIAVTLLAELHGRMGYFPPVVRLRRVADALPPRFEVAEIINLQAVREAARGRR